MITVSDELKAAFLCGNQKHLTLTFSDNTQQVDEDIYLESMEIEQSLCEEEQLTYGTTSAASFKVRLLNSGKKFKGLGVTVSISTIGDDDIEYTASLGHYTVYEDTISDDRNYRDLMCYDAFHGILDNEYADWYNALTFPMTMKQFRDAFFSHVGLTQRTAILACDSISIPANTVDSISGATIVQSICEPSGAFCFIDYDGYVQYVILGSKAGLFPHTDLYPNPNLYPRTAYDDFFDDTDPDAAPIQDGTVYSDYDCRRITQVTVARSSEKEYVTVGVPGNTYQFATNPLLMYMDATTLESIGRTFLNVVNEVIYKPSRIKGRARVWIQLGDMIGVMTQSDRLVLPVLHREMSGITALYDTYEANGKEYYEYDANSLEARMDVAEDALKDTADSIEEIHDEIDDVVIDFHQTVDGLEAKVASSQKEWDTTGYNISAYGYDTPQAEGLLPSDYTNQYYLNQTNGYIYLSNGTTWTYVTSCNSVQASLQSSITQTATSINLEVSKKVDIYGQGNNTVVSQINLSPEQITLSTGRLVINSGNFQLNAAGYATAKGITLEDGIYISDGSNLYFDNSPFISLIAYGGYGQFGVVCSGEWTLPSDTTINNNTIITSANIGNQHVNLADSATWAQSASSATEAGDAEYLRGHTSGTKNDYVSISSNGNLIPNGNDIACGTSLNPFKSGYATGSWTSSDRKVKTHIEYLEDDDNVEEFIMSLKPVEYGRKDETESIKHFGFYAQDVFQSAKVFDGRTSFANAIYQGTEEFYCDDPDHTNDEYIKWWLNYPALIAPLTALVQKQNRRIQALEQRILVLEGGN